MDARTEEEKQKISWTHALRKIVINCYKYHGREDLLPAFSEEDEKANAIATANANVSRLANGLFQQQSSILEPVNVIKTNSFSLDLLMRTVIHVD